MPTERKHRGGWVVFLVLFSAYAWFHQGGGWNQNARFDQIRAFSERGTWSIERFAYFEEVPDAGGLRAVPPPDDLRIGPGLPEPNSLDVSLHDGRMFPNKPPGVSVLGLPAQLVLSALLGPSGADGSAWWPLTLNLYLSTVFSVGLFGALGGVLFLRVSRALFPECGDSAHVAAALALGLGTVEP